MADIPLHKTWINKKKANRMILQSFITSKSSNMMTSSLFPCLAGMKKGLPRGNGTGQGGKGLLLIDCGGKVSNACPGISYSFCAGFLYLV